MAAMSGKSNISTRVTPVVVQNGFAYISGQLPRERGELQFVGKVGAEVPVEEARAAAAMCARNCISALLGQVDKQDVLRVVKVTGFIASATGFNAQGAVIDAASDVILDSFGPVRGSHARSAIGVAELPHNAPVEIEMIVALRSIGTHLA
jgi:enamine deaminase RidA (YjgF/YER057c/UK114 family)